MRDQMYVEEVLGEWRRQRQEARAHLWRELATNGSRPRWSPRRLVKRLAKTLRSGARNGTPATAASRQPSVGEDDDAGSGAGCPPLRVGDVALLPAPSINERRPIVDALRLLNETGAPGLLTTHSGRPAVVTRADIEIVLPSPATTLARYEISALIQRIAVREAVPGPTPVVRLDDELPRVVRTMSECEWRPLLVRDADDSYRMITAGAILTALVGDEGESACLARRQNPDS